MERLILSKLLDWKHSPYRKPLILKGVLDSVQHSQAIIKGIISEKMPSPAGKAAKTVTLRRYVSLLLRIFTPTLAGRSAP